MSDFNRKKREEEKERLMQEVLKKKRDYNYGSIDQKIELRNEAEKNSKEIEKIEKEVKSTSSLLEKGIEGTTDLLKKADESFLALRKVLNNQQKELNTLSEENGISDKEIEKLQEDIIQEYGLKVEEVQTVKPFDSGATFNDIFEEVKTRVVVDDKTLKQMTNAFRRPYVMGEEKGRPRNVILISGPNGSGRHETLSAVVRSMYERQLVLSDEVYTVDMSLYQSGAQEQIFLQDLYQDLSGKGSVICFENFEVGFPAFLRMLDSLVVDGKVTLSKRYVLSKGILVENQTGLVKDAVDHLSAEGKYLVFVTTKGTKAVQNAFGADFLYHVLDSITFEKLNAERTEKILEVKEKELADKALDQLKLNVSFDEDARKWIAGHYDKENGLDAITEMFKNFYIVLSQEALENSFSYGTEAQITVENGDLVARLPHGSVRLIREKNSSEEIEAVNKELDEIVGLDMVKDYIRSLQSHIQMQNLRREQGMKTSDVSKHMIFTGNPGTGKTTIARLISRYMKAIGALSQGQLVEVTRADLVAQYVGQTAPLTMSVIKSAIGGVLFIDEAYSLYRGKDDSFGLECIDTIVKAMEDNRDDLIVILAGYQKEMKGFLESNSGLKSRFPNIIHFPDYTGEELRKIAEIQARSKGYEIAEEALHPLEDYFSAVQEINAAEAGNGRLARNVVEDAILVQSRRLVENPGDKMDELRLSDFNLTVTAEPNRK
ncbi:MAG: AAA family ATPase [Solobacterium sp.]|nr:AAA family ATPase [Solobacterium sp.]